MLTDIDSLVKRMPIVCILRGITPDEIIATSDILFANGVRIMEVPLNSPQPYDSIKRLSEHLGDKCLCGAGTVLTETQAEKVFAAGGKLIVSPNTNVGVIRQSIASGMLPIPGFSTPTEAFTAIDAGATWLKLFPAAAIGIEFLQALSAVLPTHIKIVATGGVNVENAAAWLSAGVAAVGLGSDLYRPGISAEILAERAAAFATTCTA